MGAEFYRFFRCVMRSRDAKMKKKVLNCCDWPCLIRPVENISNDGLIFRG